MMLTRVLASTSDWPRMAVSGSSAVLVASLRSCIFRMAASTVPSASSRTTLVLLVWPAPTQRCSPYNASVESLSNACAEAYFIKVKVVYEAVDLEFLKTLHFTGCLKRCGKR